MDAVESLIESGDLSQHLYDYLSKIGIAEDFLDFCGVKEY